MVLDALPQRDEDSNMPCTVIERHRIMMVALNRYTLYFENFSSVQISIILLSNEYLNPEKCLDIEMEEITSKHSQQNLNHGI